MLDNISWWIWYVGFPIFVLIFLVSVVLLVYNKIKENKRKKIKIAKAKKDALEALKLKEEALKEEEITKLKKEEDRFEATKKWGWWVRKRVTFPHFREITQGVVVDQIKDTLKIHCLNEYGHIMTLFRKVSEVTETNNEQSRCSKEVA